MKLFVVDFFSLHRKPSVAPVCLHICYPYTYSLGEIGWEEHKQSCKFGAKYMYSLYENPNS